MLYDDRGGWCSSCRARIRSAKETAWRSPATLIISSLTHAHFGSSAFDTMFTEAPLASMVALMVAPFLPTMNPISVVEKIEN